ncbi:hypothetical protein [Stenotrophomonas maltophilia]|uniref:hypothetical protein n=1 Tax=Stenotrophomonas maltophilia TaxID=40324 RepID=UPI002478C8A4|nr:hypothetical protein [Stenotrophomonas maltophilia]MDH7618936.1 hypothetical protein [Stenotrophomonas maltophilia]
MPDVKLSQLAAASAASVAAGAGLWTMAGHILGLRMEYVGPASIRVSSGSAWIPSLQQAIEVPSALTLSGLILAANTWYHLYLYLNGSTPAIEAATDAPAAPYSGTARAKTGAASRRYIGSFRTDASSNIIQFQVGTNDSFEYRIPANTQPLRCLSNGTATTRTTVSLAAAVPTTATAASLILTNTMSSGFGLLSVPGVTPELFGVPTAGGVGQFFDFVLSANQTLDYRISSADTNGLYIDVRAFRIAR